MARAKQNKKVRKSERQTEIKEYMPKGKQKEREATTNQETKNEKQARI
jgi:hypothetical protein